MWTAEVVIDGEVGDDDRKNDDDVDDDEDDDDEDDDDEDGDEGEDAFVDVMDNPRLWDGNDPTWDELDAADDW